MAISLLVVTPIQQFLPPWWYITAAATLTGSKLILNCLADEVVHNWLYMLRHIPKPDPTFTSTVIMGWERRFQFRQKLRKKFWTFLEQRMTKAWTEVETTFTSVSSSTTTNTTSSSPAGETPVVPTSTTVSSSSNFGSKVKKLVAKSLRLHLTWSMTGMAVLWQWRWLKWKERTGIRQHKIRSSAGD